jgi:hypothetical protein
MSQNDPSLCELCNANKVDMQFTVLISIGLVTGNVCLTCFGVFPDARLAVELVINRYGRISAIFPWLEGAQITPENNIKDQFGETKSNQVHSYIVSGKLVKGAKP